MKGVAMKLKVRTAAVLGSGTMGAGIAAHLANCGISCLLLDIVPPELTEAETKKSLSESSPDFRNRLACGAIEQMLRAKAAPLYDPADASLITPGNLEDDFDKLAEVDWIIEAVVERLDIKHALFERLESIHREGQVISSNTSGIALGRIVEGRGQTFREHTLITHFFNPPRYMHLLELVPGKDTRPELFEAMKVFGKRTLGKGVVEAKDTPAFIGNRIGGIDLFNAIRAADELGLTVEEADAIAGPPIGRPKTGIYRLLDLVGLDVMVHVNRDLSKALTSEEDREALQAYPLVEKLVERGSLGSKSGEGFYKKTKGKDGATVILALDKETLEYGPSLSPKNDTLKKAKKIRDLGERLRFLAEQDDKVGQFVWKVLSTMLCYAANRIPEISEDVSSVDAAMRWGFSWELGPFEIFDALGVRNVAERLESEGRNVPENVTRMLDSGQESFYGFDDGVRTRIDLKAMKEEPLPRRSGTLILADQRLAEKTIRAGEAASIIDLDDGVICLELHSKANTINQEVIDLMHAAIEEAETNHRALVLTGRGDRLSAGADLSACMAAAMEGKRWVFEDMVKAFQDTALDLRHCHVPTVAALQGMALGGGCEMTMRVDRVQASAECYMGLVEIGVGLIPAGAGTTEWVARSAEKAAGEDLFPHLYKALLLMAMGEVSKSAADAFKMGYLSRGDGISRNRDSLIYDAKMLALGLARQGYRPPDRRKAIRVIGASGLGEFQVRAGMMREAGYMTEHDRHVVGKLIHILCGGEVPKNTEVDEQYMLDLEREAFLSLLGHPKTQARITHMLKTGKPLRN